MEQYWAKTNDFNRLFYLFAMEIVNRDLAHKDCKTFKTMNKRMLKIEKKLQTYEFAIGSKNFMEANGAGEQTYEFATTKLPGSAELVQAVKAAAYSMQSI